MKKNDELTQIKKFTKKSTTKNNIINSIRVGLKNLSGGVNARFICFKVIFLIQFFPHKLNFIDPTFSILPVLQMLSR